MKTINISIILTALMAILFTTATKAETVLNISRDSVQRIETAKLLLSRLDEINAIDKSSITTSETKALRKELRVIRGELKELHKGTYMPPDKLVLLLLVPFILFTVSD